jgi:uncharacterized surface protein with fasciclin (FAS1) repeats
MQFKTLAFVSLLSIALGQSTQSLTDALGSLPQLSNLTTFLGLYPDLVSQLSGATNITILAPNNAAFAALLNTTAGAAAANDTELVQAILQYHVLSGTYPSFNGTSFPVTSLSAPAYTNVTGGQVVQAVGDDSGVSFYSGLLQNASVVSEQPVNFTGGVVHIIDRVLTLPQNISTTAVAANLTSIAGALTQADLVATVDGLSDVTVFVPNNAAFQAIGSALPNLTMEQITSILTYHVVEGTVAYSTLLSNTTIASVEGTDLTITIIGDEVFVNSAQVIVPDVLVANGVVHVIDGVLNPANATATPDPAASTAAPAFPGASSVSDVPFTSGVPTPTGSVAPTSEAPGATATSEGAGVPMKTGAVGAAALFGGAAVLLNM